MGPAMTLIEPRPIPSLSSIRRAHFIGIGGAGMSGVASAFRERGIEVSGCDQVDSETSEALRNQGIRVRLGHDSDHLGDVDTIVVSTAIQPDNPELVEAGRRGLRVLHRSLALASLMPGRQVVAVAGTHGKTTTTAMSVVGLQQAGLDPSYIIGGTLMDTGSGAHTGASPQFVVEADESDGSFRQYPATIAVITGIDSRADHLDNWGTVEAYYRGFEQFATNPGVSAVIVNADDPLSVRLGATLSANGARVLRFGQSDSADVRLIDMTLSSDGSRAGFQVGQWSGELSWSLLGRHNFYNAAAALGVAEALGVDRKVFLKGLTTFQGTKRRFETIGSAHGVTVVDDYAHHPGEVDATIASARQKAEQARIIVCFQPHLYTRTRDLAADFGQALARADEVVVLDVYAAREEPIPGITGESIAQAVHNHGGLVHYVPELEPAVDVLVRLARPGDLILTVGAGSVTTLAEKIVAGLERL